MFTSRQKAAVAIFTVIIIVVAALWLRANKGMALNNTGTKTYTTSIIENTVNPVLTSAQDKILIGTNATYSLSKLNTTAEIKNYRPNFASNVSSVWLMNYLNGPIIDPNWGIEQTVLKANTNTVAQSIYLQMWRPILEPNPQQVPINGTYKGMTYSYTFNKVSYRLGFIGTMNNYVTYIVVGAENASINATQLIYMVSNDLQK
ncbi:MAG: hypothetical protein ACP5FR_01990 [Candidatus Micrarchaeia archaeon]